MPHFDRINFSLQCLHFRYKFPTVTLAHTRDIAILQSKQIILRTYGAGECRVFVVSFFRQNIISPIEHSHCFFTCVTSTALSEKKEAQWLIASSGRVVETEWPRVRASLASLRCVLS